MTGRKPPEPLWFNWKGDRDPPEHDDVTVRVLVEPEEDEEDGPSPAEQPRERRPALVLAALAALGIVLLAIGLRDRTSLTIAHVPSFWTDVPMICHTGRVDEDGRGIEWFECRAVGDRPLPPGLYSTPESQWTSDLTREDARETRIRISPDGEVAGWAVY